MSYIPIAQKNATFNGINTAGLGQLYNITYQSIAPGTPYVVSATDYIIAASNQGTGGTAIVQLPDTPVDGRVYIIFDYQGNISNYDAIEITTVSGATNIGDLIQPAFSINITNPFGSVMVVGSANQSTYFIL